jgi:RHS repeat-associated protein
VTSFYGFEGHGSVRFLIDSSGAVTDGYTFDAFGSLIASNGSTPNDYMYAGEKVDPNLGLYYLRARYLNASLGRFFSMDTMEGRPFDPPSLHRYTYVRNDSVNRVDRSGLADFSLTGLLQTMLIQGAISGLIAEGAGFRMRYIETPRKRWPPQWVALS